VTTPVRKPARAPAPFTATGPASAAGPVVPGAAGSGGPSGPRRTAATLFAGLRNPWPDRRAERTLGAVSLLVGVCVIAMIVFVGIRAWPVFAHNGLSWLGPGGNLETEIGNMQATSVNPPAAAFHLRAWPLVYGTLLTSAIAVALGLVIAVLSSIFIVELAPARLRKVVIPVIRLLASVPSVIYGLIGVLVLVPFVGNHLVTASEKASEASVVELTGAGLGVAAVILTVMITPIMIALICEALIAAPTSWREGAVALGLNPLRAVLAVTLRGIRPAIVAAAVLATARALGEAVMIQMVSGGRSFVPNPSAGVVFFFEPLRTLASSIVDYHEGVGAPALRATLYAFAALLLFAACVLSIGGYLVKLPLRKYQTRG
jgi:phosphate transport system permease protein